ncbi:hypothetical protein SELMODRAFT_17897, partial [Selaginella moellendorffii]
FMLYMQLDCNLVFYKGKTIIWSTNTQNQGKNCFLRMQVDGNLVLYNDNLKALWSN